MTKLNQIIAVANGKKTKASEALTETYKKLQKADLFDGLSRVYQPLNADDETLPDEKKMVQLTVKDAVEDAKKALTDLIDVVYIQDTANCEAKVDVVVDGSKLLEQVPVTHLLFLEKQLVDLRTFVSKLPILDPAQEWKHDPNRNCYVTETVKSNRNKKELKVLVKYDATDKHPAQTETYNEEVKVGEWLTTKFSGAISVKDRLAMAERVEKLIEAVKLAREEANSIEVKDKKIASKVLDFVFKK